MVGGADEILIKGEGLMSRTGVRVGFALGLVLLLVAVPLWSKEAKHKTRTYTGVTVEQVAKLLEKHLADTKATIHDVEKDKDGISFDGRRSMTWGSNPLAFRGFIRERGDSIVVVLDAQDNSAFNASGHRYVGKIFKLVDADVRRMGGKVREGTSTESLSGALSGAVAEDEDDE